MSPATSIEQVLRRVEDRAAMMRYLVERAADSRATEEPRVLTGLGEVFEDIEAAIGDIRRSLDATALNLEVRRRTAKSR
jgi:hypothetical protein